MLNGTLEDTFQKNEIIFATVVVVDLLLSLLLFTDVDCCHCRCRRCCHCRCCCCCCFYCCSCCCSEPKENITDFELFSRPETEAPHLLSTSITRRVRSGNTNPGSTRPPTGPNDPRDTRPPRPSAVPAATTFRHRKRGDVSTPTPPSPTPSTSAATRAALATWLPTAAACPRPGRTTARTEVPCKDPHRPILVEVRSTFVKHINGSSMNDVTNTILIISMFMLTSGVTYAMWSQKSLTPPP